MTNNKVRVRFAPSPTGPLHMGGVRTALFNYLFAKKNNGDFILRIEDTDQTRFVPGAEEYIIESLKWCGLHFSEGPGNGKYGPYRQSERKEIYKQYADHLINTGMAYFAFDTPEQLDKARIEAEQQGQVFAYGIHTRHTLQNSLTLSKTEVDQKLNSGQPFVIRFKMPEDTLVTETDIIRGEVTFATSVLDDKVIFKSDGMPTYHLANVVDDHLMEITHVIRGEEWLSSMPLHVLLYRALGWEATMPRFAHLPLILKPTGKGKLSKRDGDKMGFPVFPIKWTDLQTGEIFRGYREDGYFPEAFINLLTLLGWNPGTEQEFFTLDQLSEIFTLERVVKSGSRFDPEKAKWFNRHYFQQKSPVEIAQLFKPLLTQKGITISDEMLLKVIAQVKERCTFTADLWEHAHFFFTMPQEYDTKTIKKHWKDNTSAQLLAIAQLFETVETWQAPQIQNIFSCFVNASQWSFGTIMNPLRLCLTGGNIGPDLFVICEILGKETTLERIKSGIENIEKLTK